MAMPSRSEASQKRRKANHALALQIWNSAAETTGTLADIYLEARGLESGSRFGLRFAADVPMPSAGRHPCLLAAVVEPMTRNSLASSARH